MHASQKQPSRPARSALGLLAKVLHLQICEPFLSPRSSRISSNNLPLGVQSTLTNDFTFSNIGPLQQEQNVDGLMIDEQNDDKGMLASLFGSAHRRDHFMQHSYGRRIAHFPRCKNDEDCLDTPHQLDAPISGIDLPSLYESNEWISFRKRGSMDMLDKKETTYDEVTSYIEEGGSIVVPITPEDYLYPTKVQIEKAFGLPEGNGTTMNVYHSGPSAVALNVHYDAYPVLVLQLEGEKEWILQNDAFGMPSQEVTMWKNLTMMEGDLLYIPKGVLHAATTAEGFGSTTHVTIGLL